MTPELRLRSESERSAGPRLRDPDHNEAMALAGLAGARDAQLRAHRGANPRPADLVRDGRGPTGWRLTGRFAARAGKTRLVRFETDA